MARVVNRKRRKARSVSVGFFKQTEIEKKNGTSIAFS